MEIKEFTKKLFASAKEAGIEQYELYYMQEGSLRVSAYNGEIEKFSQSQTGGFGFRGIINGKTGNFYSESLSEDIIPLAIKGVITNCEVTGTEEKQELFPGSEVYPKVETYFPELNKISAEDKARFALLAEKTAKEFSPEIESVNTSLCDSGEAENYLANSLGLELESKSNYIVALVELTARRGEEVKEKGDIYIGHCFDEEKAKALAISAAKKAVSALGGTGVQSGKKRVIFKNEAFCDILATFADNFSGESARKGFSLLTGKIGEKIASEKITLWDRPLLKDGYASSAFDSEGVACYDKSVIEKGVLKTFLHNLKSAAYFKTKSTGNGFKPSYKGAVGVSPTNFFIENGETDFDGLLEKMQNGIIVTEVEGLHSGANVVSGDFSLAAEGFMVENGKITHPVEQITIAGNFYELLKTVAQVGNDLYFNSSAVGSPSLMFEDISVSGL